SPALADLDRDGRLDIVFGGADQRIYAVRGNGRLVKGWPVLARDKASGGDPEKILSSPAIGDLNGDGRPDVVEGTAEAYGSTPTMSGRVYAFSAKGKRLPGWPVSVPGVVVDSRIAAAQSAPATKVDFEHLLGGWDAASGDWLSSFPIPMEGWQIPTAPAIADVEGDGKAEVIAGSSGNVLHAFRSDGSEPRGWPKDTGQ